MRFCFAGYFAAAGTALRAFVLLRHERFSTVLSDIDAATGTPWKAFCEGSD
jgi:hypothetical protein